MALRPRLGAVRRAVLGKKRVWSRGDPARGRCRLSRPLLGHRRGDRFAGDHGAQQPVEPFHLPLAQVPGGKGVAGRAEAARTAPGPPAAAAGHRPGRRRSSGGIASAASAAVASRYNTPAAETIVGRPTRSSRTASRGRTARTRGSPSAAPGSRRRHAGTGPPRRAASGRGRPPGRPAASRRAPSSRRAAGRHR